MVNQSEEDYKQEASQTYRRQLQRLGNLTGSEVNELVDFEIYHGVSTVDDQVRRYYLKTKSEKPVQAAQMLAETSPLLERGIGNQSDVEQLCTILYRYWSGFLINFNGASYTMTNHQFKKLGE